MQTEGDLNAVYIKIQATWRWSERCVDGLLKKYKQPEGDLNAVYVDGLHKNTGNLKVIWMLCRRAT